MVSCVRRVSVAPRQSIIRPGRAKWRPLLKDGDVYRWHENLAPGRAMTAVEDARILQRCTAAHRITARRLAFLERDRALGRADEGRVRSFGVEEATPGSLSEAQSQARSVMEEGVHLEKGARLTVTVCDDHLDSVRKLFGTIRHRVVSHGGAKCSFSSSFRDGTASCMKEAIWKVEAQAGAFADSDSTGD